MLGDQSAIEASEKAKKQRALRKAGKSVGLVLWQLHMNPSLQAVLFCMFFFVASASFYVESTNCSLPLFSPNWILFRRSNRRFC